MISEASRTAELLRLGRDYLPGGTIHTFSHRPAGFPDFLDVPDFVVERGEGAYIWTVDGRRLLDVVLGAGSTLLGHAHPAIVSAVGAQISAGANFSHVTPGVIRLAELVVSAFPGADKVRFYNSGTEAMMFALRIARAHTGRSRIIKLEGAYHGNLDSVLFHTNYGAIDEWGSLKPVADSPGVPAPDADAVTLVPYNDLNAMSAAVERLQGELAAIVVEPVMRGIRPEPGYLAGVRDIAGRRRVPLIFDEVITGFRLAYGGAQEFYGVTADLTVLGKALGAGMPIGAVAGTEELMAWLDPGRPDGQRILAEGSTYGNPVSAAAAVANLEQLGRPGVYDGLNRTGSDLGIRLARIFSERGLVAQMTGEGSIIEFFFSESPVTTYADAMRTDLRPKIALSGGMLRWGVFGGGGRYNLSVVHGDAEIALLARAVEEALTGDLDADSPSPGRPGAG